MQASSASESETATISLLPAEGSGTPLLVLRGRLDSAGTASIWQRATTLLDKASTPVTEIDVAGVTYVDGFGAALLLDLRRRAIAAGREARLRGLKPEFAAMLEPFNPTLYTDAALATSKPPPSFLESIGQSACELIADLYGFLEFTGEVARALAHAAANPRNIRWKDVHRTAVIAGADAIPVIMLVGFLIGFVMAFQSAIPMRQFGADIFVPSLVGIAMLRELGPIMTAVGLAGRSSAAFAAEIGTMKVNEEVAALTTMGLAPVRFLVVPRIIAAVAMTPFLIIFANVAGLLGGLLVFVSLGYPVSLYIDQLQQFIALKDLLSGLFKGFVFGLIVAAVGCMRGLQTTTGASAVGRSTTSAVVSSIVLVAIGDGIFAIIYYHLGI
jgi:phospholipid/cholesterol/gamma-HCH transport system permease protein